MCIQEVFLSLFHQTSFLPQTLSHRATEQRHYCTKGKRFYSQFVPFIHYRGKARKSPVTEVETAYGKKEDLLVAGGSGGKEIEDLNVFFRPFLSSPSVFLFTFQGQKVVVTLRRQLFPL